MCHKECGSRVTVSQKCLIKEVDPLVETQSFEHIARKVKTHKVNREIRKLKLRATPSYHHAQ
jgi:hypothetical protein